MADPAADVWDVRRLLDWTRGFFERKRLDSPRVMAELLIGHVLGLDRIRLYTSHDRPVAPAELARLRDLVRRAAGHEPVQYLVGAAHFYSLTLTVTPDVLIPRPETETLVEEALRHLKLAGRSRGAVRVLDLCTGSGAIALALAKNLPAANVVATDVSDAAAAVARANAAALDLADRVEVRAGDLFDPVAGGPPFDVIAANPPYVPTGDLAGLDPNVRDHEPRLALDGGADGLDVVRRVVGQARQRLAEGGTLYVELQHDQGDRAADLARAAGWREVRVARDLGGRDRVLVAGAASG